MLLTVKYPRNRVRTGTGTIPYVFRDSVSVRFFFVHLVKFFVVIALLKTGETAIVRFAKGSFDALPVFRIRDVSIRNRIRILGSVHWIMDLPRRSCSLRQGLEIKMFSVFFAYRYRSTCCRYGTFTKITSH